MDRSTWVEIDVSALKHIAFGLSMDYEVFLLSRIKEEHDKTGDNVGSVAIGLERTGRIVTAAAALLRSEERRVGKSVDLGGRRIIKKKKKREQNKKTWYIQ